MPVFLSYVLSFIYLGIYWNNHHHLFQVAERVSGAILWTNLHLLFWLSLIPFATGWMGENHFTALPTALYGVVLLMAAVAYWLLQGAIIAEHGRDSKIARALGSDWKGKLSPVLYLAAIGLAFVSEWLASALYVLVAALRFIPDRRMARVARSGRRMLGRAERRLDICPYFCVTTRNGRKQSRGDREQPTDFQRRVGSL